MPWPPNLGEMVELSGPSCSDWSRSQGLVPVGTAGHYQGFLLVEHPLPWPEDISELPELAKVGALASEVGARLQAVFPSLSPLDGLMANATVDGPADPDTPRRLVYYRSGRPGWAAPLLRAEAEAAPGELATVAEALLAGAAPGGPEELGPLPDGGGETVDVLVCTHGRRDACCGQRGTQLFAELAPLWPAGQGRHRLWRTSHTGGHRFAPTFLVLPSATLWAYADPELATVVAGAEGAIEDVLPRYRGCAVLGPPHHQALEKAVAEVVGWPLLASGRRSIERPDSLVRLETETAGDWEAVVRKGRSVPQPECHTPPQLAAKKGTEWVVEGLRRVVSA